MPGNVLEVAVPLRRRAVGRVAWHRDRAWRDNNGRFRMALGNTGVDAILVIHAVQDRIALVFTSFLQLRTARRVTHVLRERDVALPRNDRHGEAYWARPIVAAVTSMLKNPAYAGAFAYGRTHAREAAVPEGQQNQVRRPAGECGIMVRDRYPAYVGWETHEKIQAIAQRSVGDKHV